MMPPKTNNRTAGGRFEQELAQKLADAGFWVHVLQQNKAGQPADIIAAKGNYFTLIDCKVVSNGAGFPLRRVEENQRYAMQLFSKRTDNVCWFAVRLPDGEIHMLSSVFVFYLIRSGCAAVSEDTIRGYTLTYDAWVDRAMGETRSFDEDDDW